MTHCYVALGGNIGPVEHTFERAIADLAAEPRVGVGRVSSVYRTRAVGAVAGDDFLNAAVELHAALPPLELLDLLAALEDRYGRVRAGRWTPRTLDLDLLLYGSEIIDEPRLKVPHPALWHRRFVLDPLAEIAADVVHPVKGVTIGTLRERLLPRPLPVALGGGPDALRRQLLEQIAGEFPAIRAHDWQAQHRQAQPDEPALLFWLGPPESLGLRFDDLPPLPRLDASAASDPAAFVRDALQAALG